MVQPILSAGAVLILGDRAGLKSNAASVIMKKGEFLAEVDASIWSAGDRVVSQDFVARAYTLDQAKKELDAAAVTSGGVIVEHPVGLFHVFTTSLVSEKNVMESKIDESDSRGGLISPESQRYYGAWLQLRSAARKGPLFQVY